jgi:hypothetical protein
MTGKGFTKTTLRTRSKGTRFNCLQWVYQRLTGETMREATAI